MFSMSTPLPIVPTATQEVVDAQDTLERLEVCDPAGRGVVTVAHVSPDFVAMGTTGRSRSLGQSTFLRQYNCSSRGKTPL